jgi:Ca2+-binding EF-hand superfamily protein
MPSPLKGVEALSMNEMNVTGKQKDHPSISDYYKAAAGKGDSRSITYQHGLSNFSSVQLGDDRVTFKKSLSQDVYKLDTERQAQMNLADAVAESVTKPPEQLAMDYREATEIVGSEKISQMEQMMRDKLQQRTKTGPFQLRKTFKYFDRDGSGGIDFDEFQRAMELMGFQFTEMQQLGLFARYDGSCSGEVDYTEFVNKLMESDFKGVASTAHGGRLHNMVRTFTATESDLLHGEAEAQGAGEEEDSDVDDDERERFRRAEVMNVFRMLDKNSSNTLDKGEVELLMRALGKNYTKKQLNDGWERVDTDRSGVIDFDEFYNWYNDMGGGRK